MKKYIRPILSLISIVIFLIITLATDLSFLSVSSNTTVKTKNCQERPAAQGKLNITVVGTNNAGGPLAGQQGRLYITHQKVRPDTCVSDILFFANHEFTLDANGKATYEGPDWIHDNSEDLWRVEVSFFIPPLSQRQLTVRRYTLVKKYSDASVFSFVTREITPL